MRETHSLELRERPEEVPREQLERLLTLVKLRADAVAPVVDAVPAAPEHAVVLAHAEVVEEDAGVAEALAALPADRGALVATERLGHQCVVVDRHGVEPQAFEEGGEGVGRQHRLAGAHLAGRRVDHDAGAGAAERRRRRALEDAHAQLTADAS